MRLRRIRLAASACVMRRSSSSTAATARSLRRRGSGGGRAQSATSRPSPGDRMRMRVDSVRRLCEIVRDQQSRRPMLAPITRSAGPASAPPSAVSSEISGSSSIRKSGSTSSARASAARRCMPPDSWPGSASSLPASSTSCQQRPRALGRLRPAHQQQVVEDAEPGHQARLLEHDAEPRPLRRLPGDAAGIDGIEPGDDAQQRGLARAGRPDQAARTRPARSKGRCRAARAAVVGSAKLARDALSTSPVMRAATARADGRAAAAGRSRSRSPRR